MSILVYQTIQARLADRSLVVEPLGHDAVQPASIDLRLHPEILIAEADGGHRSHHLVDDGPYLLSRGVFVLAATLEHVEIPADLVGILVGKSSRAREGIAVEDAGYVDPGWKGQLTLEIDLRGPEPRRLMVGMAICQLRLETTTAPCARPYGSPRMGRYQGSVGPVASRGVIGGAS